MKIVKNYSPKTKILSLLLSFLVVFYLLPTSVFAEGLGNDTAVSDSSTSSNDENATYTPGIYEVTELREENVKHFRLEDGSYVAAQYNYPVHYTDANGQLIDIDNRLTESGSELSTGTSRIKFVKKITGNGNIFTLHENNTKITMGLVGAEKKTEGVAINNNSDKNIESALGKMTNLENISSTIRYEDILDGVDIEYVIHSLNIKENIIVKEKKDSYSYSFTIELNNLTATLADDGNVYITSFDGTTQYIIPAPIVYDANGTYAPDAASAYTLSEVDNGKYELNVSVDAAWMNAETRAFPITIDPTIGVPHGYTVDLDIASGAPSVNFEDDFSLNVSSTWRSYWKIPTEYLPSLPNTAHIWKAELKLFGGGYDTYVGAYEITSNWDETLTWNKTISSEPQGVFSSSILDYHKLSSSDTWYAFDLTEVAKKWYNGENNYGVGLKLVDGTDTTKSASFYSHEYYDDYDDRFVEPCFYVYYSDISGLEDYSSLSSHSAAGIGSGSINLASGNLTIVSDLVSTTDYLMPMTVSAVYNSDLAGKDYNISNSFSAYTTSYMPYGFKLNITETIIQKTMITENGSSTQYCILLDSDGTNHYFYYVPYEGYVDDSAQGRTLEILSDGKIEITYRDQSKKTFTKMSSNPSGTTGGWVLSKITDSYGNSIIISLNSSYQPTKVSLLPNGNTVAIDMITLTYSGGKLYQIESPNSRDYVTFNYSSTYNGSASGSSGRYLKKITYGNRNSTSPYTIAQIEYNSSGRIVNVQNSLLSYKTIYSWNGNRVSNVAEYSNATFGQRVAYMYGESYTDIRSTGNDESLGTGDDIVTRYIYDIYGRTVSAHSGSVGFEEIYGATMGSYETAEKAKNSIKETTIVYDRKDAYLENNNGDYFAALQGGITKNETTGCYKQVVFEESNPAGVTFNADMQYIISGFGYSNSITQNENAKFSLSVKVYYYQGVNKDDITVTHHYDFLDVENTWQFISGKLDCLISSTSSAYDVVRKIELICNYYGQIDVDGESSYANFKNIAFTDNSDYSTYRYSYDVNTGNLVMKSDYAYREYYEYNDKNSVTRIANNKGEIYDYEYATDGITLVREIYYKFNRQGSFPGNLLYEYPYGEDNIEDKIYKTKINQTQYTYTAQGLTKSIKTYGATASTSGIISSSYTYVETEGSKIFGALLTETNSLGNTTKYFYDNSNGDLLAQIDIASGSGYVYDYNEYGFLEGVIPATGNETSYSGVINAESVSYEYDSNTKRLTKIITDSTDYSFSYDSFGNSTGVTAGNNSLATYEYYGNNGKLNKINYGNGFSEEYVYDALEMLAEIWYNYDDGTRVLAYSYTYNKDGTLAEFENHLDGTSIEYKYDVHGRFISSEETNSSDPSYTNDYVIDDYDEEGRVATTINTIDYVHASGSALVNITKYYNYNNNGSLKDERFNCSVLPSTIIDYYYDCFDRVTTFDRRIDGFRYKTEYTYYLNNYKTNGLVSEVTNTVNGATTTYNYTYDSKGNITKIVRGESETTYTYDDLGQLTSEHSGRITINYTYDNAGNITAIQTVKTSAGGGSNLYALLPPPQAPETTTINLTYSNSQWGDLLTSYDGTTITYDEIGNPLSYYNGSAYTFTWEGRRLIGATKGSDTMSFTYDDNGIRTSKTVNNVKHSYYLNGSQIVAEEWSDKLLVYLYDASGSPIGMMFRKTSYAADQWDVYWFTKNLQGDIVAVYNSSGQQEAYYTYTDAWGNHTTYYTNGGGSTGAQYNPFRYRGYYYDTDLGMYYLQSRYYDAKICRFINADSALYHSMLGYNMFAYCESNPLIRADYNGDMWQFVPALDPANMVYGGGGDNGLFGFHPGYNYSASYDSSAHGTYLIRTSTASYDAYLGGYYYDGGSYIGGITSLFAIGEATVTDGMATGINGKGFEKFQDLKDYLGSAGENNHWHHIVEQCQIDKSGFSPQQIHNTNNIVAVNRSIHSKISGYYSSKQDFTGQLTVRDWLAGQSYKAQYEFGIKIFNEYTR